MCRWSFHAWKWKNSKQCNSHTINQAWGPCYPINLGDGGIGKLSPAIHRFQDPGIRRAENPGAKVFLGGWTCWSLYVLSISWHAGTARKPSWHVCQSPHFGDVNSIELEHRSKRDLYPKKYHRSRGLISFDPQKVVISKFLYKYIPLFRRLHLHSGHFGSS